MRRFWLIAFNGAAAGALLLALLVGDGTNRAMAQDKRAVTPQLHSAQPKAPNPATIPGTTAHEHAQLRRQITILQKRITALQSALQKMQQQTMNKLQSMRPAVCTSETELFNPALKLKGSCTPYMCDRVAGVCRETCRKTSDCASGYVCDVNKGNGKCVRGR